MESNNTNSTLDFLKNTFTSNEIVKLSDEDTITFTISRESFRNWMSTHEEKYFFKFVDRTTSADQRRVRNKSYMDETLEEKKRKIDTGRPRTLFSEVPRLIFTKKK